RESVGTWARVQCHADGGAGPGREYDRGGGIQWTKPSRLAASTYDDHLERGSFAAEAAPARTCDRDRRLPGCEVREAQIGREGRYGLRRRYAKGGHRSEALCFGQRGHVTQRESDAGGY